MYAIRLKLGTYSPPLQAGMYVAQSVIPSEMRFTHEIQYARTWDSYEEAYGYLDEYLYGSADVVPVVSMPSLLAEINKIGDNNLTIDIPQFSLDNSYYDPQDYTSEPHSSLSDEDNTLYLYRLYRTSEFSVNKDASEVLAEEWATDAEASEVNKEAIGQGFIWVKVTE